MIKNILIKQEAFAYTMYINNELCVYGSLKDCIDILNSPDFDEISCMFEKGTSAPM